MMQRWYNPVTRTYEQVVPPANDARAVRLLADRKNALRVYNYLRGPAHRMSVQEAFQYTWQHFREKDEGRPSPIALEVEDV